MPEAHSEFPATPDMQHEPDQKTKAPAKRLRLLGELIAALFYTDHETNRE